MQPVVKEIAEDIKKEREEAETLKAMAEWRDKVIAQHIMFAKGAEIIFCEFREIIVEIAVRLKEKIDPKTGKMTIIFKKFIEDWLLRRLQSFVKFQIPSAA